MNNNICYYSNFSEKLSPNAGVKNSQKSENNKKYNKISLVIQHINSNQKYSIS